MRTEKHRHSPDRPEGPMPRRGTDRFEDVVAWLLASLGLLTLVIALLVGLRVHGTESERARVETAERARTQAVLLADAVPATPVRSGYVPTSRVPARWVDPRDGTEQVGDVQVHGRLSAGATVRVWVDRAGHAVPAPVTAADAVLAAVLAGAGVGAAGLLLLGGGWRATRAALDAHNAAAWAREWAAVEPRWSGRRDRHES